MYKFKPLVFVRHDTENIVRPKGRSGHRIVCNEKNLYSYGGFNPSIQPDDPDMRYNQTWLRSRPLFKEIWKFNLCTNEWVCLPGCDNMPNELASNAVLLLGNSLFIYGGTGVPFGDRCSNDLYVYNIKNGRMLMIKVEGELPEPQYGQALIYHEPYLYTVGGTTGTDYTCDIHRLNLKDSVWESVYICTGGDQNEPTARYRHELAFDGKIIYVLGGGTSAESFGFADIPAFNLEKRKWMVLHTHGDYRDNTVPEPRLCHSCVQYKDEITGHTLAVISGGYNESRVFSDLWKLDLDLLQWTCLGKWKLPYPVYFHSAALTPAGRMYTFGGIINAYEVVRTYAVHSAWLKIPKLSEICWEALNYYYRNLKYKSSNELLHMGIPKKFVARLS